MGIRRVGSATSTEQPEDIKREIEGLQPEIEEAGNSVVDQINSFVATMIGSEDPTKRDEARVALHRLKGFTLQPGANEASSSSTATNSPGSAPASSTSSKKGTFKEKVISWLKRAYENAREDGPPKASNFEPKA